MPEKYFATVMKKTPLGENEFMFTPESVTAGDIDPKTRVLTTYTQDRYIPITALDSKEENIAGYYTNPLETEKVNEVFRKDVWAEAVEEYNERALQLVYYVVKHGEDAIVSVIDRAKLLKTAADVKENKKQAEELKSEQPIAEQDEQYPEKDEEETMLDPTDIVQLLDDYNDYDENKLTEIIKVLVEKVIDGKLSPDQLTDLQEIFQEVISEAESAVESVKLQRETIEHEMAPAVEKTQPRVPTPQPLTVKKEETTKLSNETPSQVLTEINIKELFEKVTKTLVAQDEGARRMIVEISRLIDSDERNYAILLTGDTGVGKTLLMSLIALYVGRPFIKIDSTQLTGAGYVGNSIEESLWKLYEKCGKNKALAEEAIVYFDEIDKKGNQNKNAVNGKQVLDSLLAFIEGTENVASKHLQQQNDSNTVVIDTSKMIKIASGAFLDVYRHKKASSAGFKTKEQQEAEEKMNGKPKPRDFVTLGNMTDEFMGRNQVIIHLNDMTVDSLKDILLQSDNSAIKRQEGIFAKKKVKLTTKEGYVKKVAEAALKSETGARSLNAIVIESTWYAYEDICNNPGQYDEVILTEETVENPKVYQLVKKQTN